MKTKGSRAQVKGGATETRCGQFLGRPRVVLVGLVLLEHGYGEQRAQHDPVAAWQSVRCTDFGHCCGTGLSAGAH